MPKNSVYEAAKAGNYSQLAQSIEQHPELINTPVILHNGNQVYPLEQTLCNQHYDCAILLLEKNANPNIPYSFSEVKATPLHSAAEKHILPEILLLLYFNADAAYKDEARITPLAALNLSPTYQKYKITTDNFRKIIENFKQLHLLEAQLKDVVKNNKQAEQIEYAIALGDTFKQLGDQIIGYPQGIHYYLDIAKFFYEKAISHYSLVADLYYKQFDKLDMAKDKYCKIGELLANLYHATQNFSMRDYYDKKLLEIDRKHEISNVDIEWRKQFNNVKTQTSDNHASFWASISSAWNKFTLSNHSNNYQSKLKPFP